MYLSSIQNMSPTNVRLHPSRFVKLRGDTLNWVLQPTRQEHAVSKLLKGYARYQQINFRIRESTIGRPRICTRNSCLVLSKADLWILLLIRPFNRITLAGSPPPHSIQANRFSFTPFEYIKSHSPHLERGLLPKFYLIDVSKITLLNF